MQNISGVVWCSRFSGLIDIGGADRVIWAVWSMIFCRLKRLFLTSSQDGFALFMEREQLIQWVEVNHECGFSHLC